MLIWRRITQAFLLLLLAWVLGFACFAFQSLATKKNDLELTADAIIVLTGGLNRIDEGLQLFATGKASHLFISGVHKDVKKSDIFERWQGDIALPPCCLELGRTATSTVENAEESQKWARDNDITSIILVTSNYHMARSLLEFRSALPDVEIIPYPIVQDNLEPNEKRIWWLLFVEYHKVLLRGLQILSPV